MKKIYLSVVVITAIQCSYISESFSGDIVSKEEIIAQLSGNDHKVQRKQGFRTRGISFGQKIEPVEQETQKVAASSPSQHSSSNNVTFSDLNFLSNSTKLADANSKKQLQIISEAFKSDALQSGRYKVVGHTDSRGSAQYNQKLSYKRAKVTKKAICSASPQICNKIEVVGLGESDPVASNSTSTGRGKNRRVVIQKIE